jgi:thioredoxin-like negative regulator of GroEL
MIKISTTQEYFEFIESCPFALIHFWAEWKAYDFQMIEKLKVIESSYSGKVCFGSIDIDLQNMRQICLDVKIINVPALGYYKVGKYIETVIGLNQEIEKQLNLLLS